MIPVADLLTHVLSAYIVAKLLSIRYPWITTPYVTAAMVGGVLPDLNRIELVLPAETVETLIGLPFSWGGLHRGGPVLVSVLIVGYLVPPRYRRGVILMAGMGAGLHLVMDLFLGSGFAWEPSFAVLWPLTSWQPVVPGFYSSRDVRIGPLFVMLAVLTWAVTESIKQRRTAVSA